MTFNNEEHKVWQDLIRQQLQLVKQVACPEFLIGLELLNLSIDRIPKVEEVSEKLYNITGWNLIPVNGLVSSKIFFNMLANKQFPVVNVIRSRKEINFYTNEAPDIFHEFFGHCPLITNKKYAEHMYKFGNYALNCSDELLLRLSDIYWATFEFGLINNNHGIKVFGAGILPSKSEIERVTGGNIRKIHFNVFSKINASLQGNIMQPAYYTINSLDALYDLINNDIDKLMNMNYAA